MDGRRGGRSGVWGSLACALTGMLIVAPARTLAGAADDPASAPASYRPSAQQDRFLDRLEHDTFRFFWDNSRAGLMPDRFPTRSASSVAAVGFALTSYLVGAERGWVTRSEAAARTLRTLETLWRAPQGRARSGTAGTHGFYYHFLDVRDGLRADESELSTIDTALLMAGVLSAQVYFDRHDDPTERAIGRLADSLYRRVDWTWAYSPRRSPLLSLGWTPEDGYIDFDWSGYSEGMLLYVLALGSPTHPIDADAWDRWTRTYQWESFYGPPYLTFGPLFGHQYSHAWIDFRDIRDRFMRSKQSDYFVNSVRATYANRAYCIANPGRWKGYGALLWGLTASDGPGDADADPGPNSFRAYWARAPGPDASRDDGTIAPTAVGGSVPFAPDVAIPTLMHLRDRFGARLYGRYGFRDAFNLSFPRGSDGAREGWFDPDYLAIDQGPILLMIENFRTGLVWSLMKKSAYVVAGLKRAGFTGGWLEPSSLAQRDTPPRP